MGLEGKGPLSSGSLLHFNSIVVVLPDALKLLQMTAHMQCQEIYVLINIQLTKSIDIHCCLEQQPFAIL